MDPKSEKLSTNLIAIQDRPYLNLNTMSDNSRNAYRVALVDKKEEPYWQFDTSTWDFEQLTKLYHKLSPCCLSHKLGVIYDHRNSQVTRIYCGKWHCDRCRQRMKAPLAEKMKEQVEKHNLTYHIVITTEGMRYRNKNTYYQSFIDMSAAWNKIRYILNYEAAKKGIKLTYINFPRSQKNGYCHLHILTNYNPGTKRLQKIVKKYPNTNFIKIKDCHDTVDYLAKDFKKDHEWIIPLGRRHYTTSRDIDLSMPDDEIDPTTKIHIRLDRNEDLVEQVYDQIDFNFHYPPPLQFLMQEWILKTRPPKPPRPPDPDFLRSGLYIDGVFKHGLS